jgi:hypothetical protein
MKRTIILTTSAVLAICATPALAQTRAQTGTTTTITTPPGASVTLSGDQRMRIKQYVTERHLRPTTIRERIRVGSTLPADVELEAVPSEWGPEVSHYRYIYSGDHVVLVDPSTRRVMHVVE